jgi:DNA-directed RNA polymerase I subunit RPA43
MAPIASPEAGESKREKKHKKDKSAKKRDREDDGTVDTERKHKKSKSVGADMQTNSVLQPNGDAGNGDLKASKKEKKSKKDRVKPETNIEDENGAEPAVESSQKKDKKKKRKVKSEDDMAAGTGDLEALAADGEKKKKKKEKKSKVEREEDDAAPADESIKKKSKKSKKHRHEEAPAKTKTHDEHVEAENAAEPDAMDVDVAPISSKQSSKSKTYQPTDIPANPRFPFFDQTVSLYEPLFPNGWAQPITGCESQHLRHLQNRYVPSLRGVLLDYSNVTLGEEPGRAGAATDDDSPTVLYSKNEFGGGFGWITADVHLFVPSRGAWMEGSVNLQTEGHIGVVCFGKFNASIEARRLPPSWKWRPNEDASGFEETASVFTAPDEHGVSRQIHSTGFWVDERDEKVRGKVRFRIRNFDVGVSGESTYLSLQGTMLDAAGEKQLVKQEASEARDRKKGGRGGTWLRARAPDFSKTTFGGEDEQGQQGDASANAYEEPTPAEKDIEQTEEEQQPVGEESAAEEFAAEDLED